MRRARVRAARQRTGAAIILNFGFAGADQTGPTVGDIVVADRILFFKNRLFTAQAGLSSDVSEGLASQLEKSSSGRNFCVHRGTFVTTGEIIDKVSLARLLPDGTAIPVLEIRLRLDEFASSKRAEDGLSGSSMLKWMGPKTVFSAVC